MSKHSIRHHRRSQRNSKAAKAVRERKSALPWTRAVRRVQELVEAGQLPPGCSRVAEAMARCHGELGQGVAMQLLWIGYGNRGDPHRERARAAARAAGHEGPVHEGIAEEASLSRRWAIACLRLLVQSGIVRRWYGGPHERFDDNVRARDQRDHPRTGRPRGEHLQGIGGTGNANGYTVEGIPDPQPPPGPRPAPADPGPQQDEPNSAGYRRFRAALDEREHERLQRRATELVRGP
jgi:hypothetical protein